VRPVEIADVRPDGSNLDATLVVDDERIPIRYRASVPLSVDRADAFLPVGLLAAMRTGATLVLPGPLSPRLLEAVATLQDIIVAFSDGELRAVPVDAEPATDVPTPAGRGIGAFFGGGVDAWYTALEHADELTHLVHCQGFDAFDPASARGSAALRNAEEAADGLGTGLVVIDTNVRAVCARFGTRSIAWGPGLATVALLLQSELERIAVAASDYYGSLVPWGTHPLLDPLWSTEAIEIDHDGCESRRSEKVVRLATCELALQHLRVCNLQTAEWNCGRCEKCLRTQATLRLAGALGRCPSFPDTLDVRALSRLPMTHDPNRTYTRENIRLAREVGDWPVLAALVWSLRPRPMLWARRRAGTVRRALNPRRSTRTGG
jgi:hypothetical protein